VRFSYNNFVHQRNVSKNSNEGRPRSSNIVTSGNNYNIITLVATQLHSTLDCHVTEGWAQHGWVHTYCVMPCVVDLTLCVVMYTIWPKDSSWDLKCSQKATSCVVAESGGKE